MRFRIKHGNGEHGDLAAAAIVCVLESGLFYLGERVHAPEQTRMIDTGPPDPPLRID
jgi:hypothetical protein